MIRLLSFLGLMRGVYLRDFEGKTYTSYARRDLWDGGWTCPVFPSTGVGHVALNADGTTGGASSYIMRWRWIYPPKAPQA